MTDIPGQFNLRVETQISPKPLPEQLVNYGWTLMQAEKIRFIDRSMTVYVYARICTRVTDGHPSVKLT